MFNVFYFMPGRNANDDISILGQNSEKIAFKTFKELLSDSYNYLNFNYPQELLSKKVVEANILSFYKTDKHIFFGRTVIVGKDKASRHYPVTKVIKCSLNDEKQALEELFRENLEYNIPPYSSNVNTQYSLQSNYSKYYFEIQDWKTEIDAANSNLINNLQSNHLLSGKSLIFNPLEKSKYDVYYFYSKKKDKHKDYLKYLLLILLVILVLFLISISISMF